MSAPYRASTPIYRSCRADLRSTGPSQYLPVDIGQVVAEITPPLHCLPDTRLDRPRTPHPPQPCHRVLLFLFVLHKPGLSPRPAQSRLVLSGTPRHRPLYYQSVELHARRSRPSSGHKECACARVPAGVCRVL